MSDEQDWAEGLDDDVVSGDDMPPQLQTEVLTPADVLRGVPFSDADVTDESFAERTAQEEPELTPDDIDERFADPEPPVV